MNTKQKIDRLLQGGPIFCVYVQLLYVLLLWGRGPWLHLWLWPTIVAVARSPRTLCSNETTGLAKSIPAEIP